MAQPCVAPCFSFAEVSRQKAGFAGRSDLTTYPRRTSLETRLYAAVWKNCVWRECLDILWQYYKNRHRSTSAGGCIVVVRRAGLGTGLRAGALFITGARRKRYARKSGWISAARPMADHDWL